MSGYTPSRHHGLQVTNIENIVMSYVLKIYYKEVWLLLSGLCMIAINLSSSESA